MLVRFPCIICGGHTGKEDVLPKVEGLGMVCLECLEAGAGAVSQRLNQRATALEGRAAELRKLAQEEWRMPSVAEWEAETRAAELEWEAETRADELEWEAETRAYEYEMEWLEQRWLDALPDNVLTTTRCSGF
jgi:hypothetical protein